MKCSGATYYTDYMERGSIKAVQKEEMMRKRIPHGSRNLSRRENGRARAAQSQR